MWLCTPSDNISVKELFVHIMLLCHLETTIDHLTPVSNLGIDQHYQIPKSSLTLNTVCQDLIRCHLNNVHEKI